MNENEITFPSADQLAEALKKERHRKSYGRALRSTIYSLLVVVALAVIVAVLLMPVMKISGESMTPTLEEGDWIITIKDHKYETGEVIGFYYNNQLLVKRVIAYAGDWVDIDVEGNVYVNGVALEEPYLTEKAMGECDITLPYQVPDGKCFVMGDHRLVSVDSRNSAVGCVADDAVVGRLLWRVWPLNTFGSVR